MHTEINGIFSSLICQLLNYWSDLFEPGHYKNKTISLLNTRWQKYPDNFSRHWHWLSCSFRPVLFCLPPQLALYHSCSWTCCCSNQSADCYGTTSISCSVMTATKNTSDGKTGTAWCSRWSTPTVWHVCGGTKRWGVFLSYYDWHGNVTVTTFALPGLCPTESRQHDVRKNVPRSATLLQAERHQEGTRTEAPLQVCLPPDARSFSPPSSRTRKMCIDPSASFLHDIRFLKLPSGAKRLAVDRGGSAERTPPRDQDFEELSPESSEDHFEVSPDRTSPQPPS